MINADLVTATTLAKTIRHDAHTELWARYCFLSRNIRQWLEPESAMARGLYHQHDIFAALSFLAFASAIAILILAFIFFDIPFLAAGTALFIIFIIVEFRKKEILIALSCEILITLFADRAPQGTLFEFGEEISRRYSITSFVDFSQRIDTLLKRIFLILYATGFISLSTDFKTWTIILMLTTIWPFFLRPIRLLRASIRLA